MTSGSSDLVRSVAVDKFVRPAKDARKQRFSIAVRDLMDDLSSSGFPRTNYPQICTSLRTRRFLRENSLEIERVDGPPSGLSTTVVFHYRIADYEEKTASVSSVPHKGANVEKPQERAQRVTAQLRGLLRDELAEYGGGEAFLRWIRSEDDENPVRETTNP